LRHNSPTSLMPRAVGRGHLPVRAVLAFLLRDAAAVAAADTDPPLLGLELLFDAGDPVARPAPSAV